MKRELSKQKHYFFMLKSFENAKNNTVPFKKNIEESFLFKDLKKSYETKERKLYEEKKDLHREIK